MSSARLELYYSNYIAYRSELRLDDVLSPVKLSESIEEIMAWLNNTENIINEQFNIADRCQMEKQLASVKVVYTWKNFVIFF